MTNRTIRIVVALTVAFLVSALAVTAYSYQDRTPTIEDARAALVRMKGRASRDMNSGTQRERQRGTRDWADADLIERILAARGRADPTRPPPVVVPPPREPPPTTTPPPAGPWVDPSALGKLGTLTPLWGTPPPLWGTELQKLPAVLEGVEISAQAKGSPIIPCLVEGAHQGTLRWSRFRIRGAPMDDGVVRARWGARWFDVEDVELSDFEIRDIPDEHGLYWNTIGGFTVRRGLFDHMGSQAIQVAGAKAERAHETGLGDQWQAHVDANRWDWQVVEDCAAIECGFNPQRASYAFSFFGYTPNPVRIQRCFIETKTAFHPDTSGAMCDSYGAVMAHGRLRFELLESALLYANGDRDTLQLWGIGDGDQATVDIYLRGSQIEGRGVDIRMAKAGDCQIRIEGCWGGAPVTISTALFDAKPVPADRVLYKGKVSANYTWSKL